VEIDHREVAEIASATAGKKNPASRDSSGCSVQLVKYRTRNREVAGSTHTRSTASNLEQVANLLRAQANLASYPQPDGK